MGSQAGMMHLVRSSLAERGTWIHRYKWHWAFGMWHVGVVLPPCR